MKTCLFPSRGIVAAFHGVSARMTLALVSVVLIGGMASCTFDDTDLQNSIDDLTSHQRKIHVDLGVRRETGKVSFQRFLASTENPC